MVVLSGEHAGVQEDERHDQPEHPLRLADAATLPLHGPVPSGGKKSILLFSLAPWDMGQNASCLDYVDTYFSNRFIRFCHGVCLICFRDIFRPSSETLAVTVTEIISN